MTLRRGETLLLTVGIPVVFLVFFSTVHVVSTGSAQPVSPSSSRASCPWPSCRRRWCRSASPPGSSAATACSSAWAPPRSGRPRLLGAKIATVLLVEVVQAAVLVPVGLGLGWDPGGTGGSAAAGQALAVALLATVAFGGLGLLLAGVLRAEVNLAAANGLYLVLLLLGGMVVPLAKLPGRAGGRRPGPAAAALSDGLHAALGTGTAGARRRRGWCSASGPWRRPLAAALTFRWE